MNLPTNGSLTTNKSCGYFSFLHLLHNVSTLKSSLSFLVLVICGNGRQITSILSLPPLLNFDQSTVGVSYYDSSVRQLHVLEVWEEDCSDFTLINMVNYQAKPLVIYTSTKSGSRCLG